MYTDRKEHWTRIYEKLAVARTQPESRVQMAESSFHLLKKIEESQSNVEKIYEIKITERAVGKGSHR
jgi:hypothetical protein